MRQKRSCGLRRKNDIPCVDQSSSFGGDACVQTNPLRTLSSSRDRIVYPPANFTANKIGLTAHSPSASFAAGSWIICSRGVEVSQPATKHSQ